MLNKIKGVFSSAPVARKRQLTGEDIMKGFNKLSKKLGQLNPNRFTDPVVIIVSGGTISVLILNNRLATKDVDYFTFDHEVISEISAAKDALQYGSLQELPPNWINAEMIAFVFNHQGCESLFENSVRQNEMLFCSDTLHVYVADWKFQLVGKITRAYQQMELLEVQNSGTDSDMFMSAINAKEINMMDAVYILRLLIEQRQGTPLDFSEMQTWYFYGPALDLREILYVNYAYCTIFCNGNTKDLPISTTA